MPVLADELASGGGGGGPVKFPLAALATRYVAGRERRGDITKGHADNIRRVLYDFAQHAPADPRRVTRRHIESFLSRPDLAPATNRQRLSIVRNFFRWAVIERHIRKDPTAAIERIEQPPSIPGSLPRDKAEATHVLYLRLEPRVRLMVSLEINDALRRVEVARAQVADIDRRARSMRVRGKARGGRGAPTHNVALSPETMAALTVYLSSEPGVLGLNSLASGPLFRDRRPNMGHKGISAQTVGKLVAAALYELGVKEAPRDGVSGHALRHTAASEALEAGVPMPVVQRQLGHASEATTGIYTKGAAFNLRQFHDKRREHREATEEILDLRDDM